MGALSLGNLLLGSAAAPAMSAIASGYAGMGVESRIPWSALEYSGTDITAISGSAIGGNIDTSDFVHTADMSGYATTGDLDGKLDTSAFSSVSGTFLTAVPADYATTAYVDSSVSGKADATALTGYQPALTFGYSGSSISSIDGSAIGGQVDPSQFVPVSAASSWSADILTLSGMVTSLQSQLGDKYRLSAGPGISMVNDTVHKITTISTI